MAEQQLKQGTFTLHADREDLKVPENLTTEALRSPAQIVHMISKAFLKNRRQDETQASDTDDQPEQRKMEKGKRWGRA